MKITLEIPDAIFRRAKCLAGKREIPLRALILEALTDELRACNRSSKPWMSAFGKLRHLRRETAGINRLIEVEFEQMELTTDLIGKRSVPGGPKSLSSHNTRHSRTLPP